MRTSGLVHALALGLVLAGPRFAAAGNPPYSAAALESLVTSVVAEVEQIRGHAFAQPVPVRVVDAETVRRYVLARVDEHLPPDLLRNESAVYADLGLLDPDLDLLETMLTLLQQEVAGFYDPQEKVVFLLDHQPWSAAGVFLAHEMTHALDDQLFDLDHNLREGQLENDRSVAHAGAREGSGSVVMTVYMTRAMKSGQLDLEALTEAMTGAVGSRDALDAAPAVIQRGLLAPYLLGQHFVLRGHPMRMWSTNLPADLDTVLTRLPQSSEQLLHPEKYWSEAEYDPPRAVVLPPLDSVAGAGWEVAGEGTIGELDLACVTGACPVPSMLGADGWTNEGAQGWGGDRWQLLRRGEQTLTVWALAWDGTDDAAEFERDARLPSSARVRSAGRRTVVVAGEACDRFDDLLRAALAGMVVQDAQR